MHLGRLSLGRLHFGMVNLGMLQHFLAGAQVLQPLSPHWPEATTDWGEPWGEAMPQVAHPLPCPPARLTPHAPRARARLTLNIKGFNMGEVSPWQTSVKGSRSRATKPPHDSRIFGQTRHRLPTSFPEPEALRPIRLTTPPNSVLPSPRRGYTWASQPIHRQPEAQA